MVKEGWYRCIEEGSRDSTGLDLTRNPNGRDDAGLIWWSPSMFFRISVGILHPTPSPHIPLRVIPCLPFFDSNPNIHPERRWDSRTLGTSVLSGAMRASGVMMELDCVVGRLVGWVIKGGCPESVG
jgi:hypothetical protein